MKKVILVFALVLGFAATSFAQPGAAKCAWGSEQSHGDYPVVLFNNIYMHGILDSEGEPTYTVSLRSNFTTNIANNVYLNETKSGKKIWMSQVSPGSAALPKLCSNFFSNMDLSNLKAYSSPLTKVVVYVSVRKENNNSVYVVIHKPSDIKITL